MTYSLLPRDVGFCPRRLGLMVLLPADARRVHHRRWPGSRVAVGRSADAIADQLRRAGYRVRVVIAGTLAFER